MSDTDKLYIERRCDNCGFWWWPEGRKEVGNELGYCERFPPFIPSEIHDRGFTHPSTFSFDGCGEFISKYSKRFANPKPKEEVIK